MDVAARRIALYSHDAVGIGHVRRNLRVAQALIGAGGTGGGSSALLLAGVHEVGAFHLPDGIDCLALPALSKSGGGAYFPRRLHVPGAQAVALRAAVIRAALDSFAPDVLVVDKLPRGVMRELDPAIESLRRAGRTRFVLGLRDVLDEPTVVQQEWLRDDFADVVGHVYDAVWVYGCPAVHDAVREYRLPDAVAAKVRYTGYFDTAPAPPQTRDGAPPANGPALTPTPPYALCMVGGGEDGGLLAEAFARATLPAGWQSVLVTGPFMPAARRDLLEQIAARGGGGLRVIEFCTDMRPLIAGAERVVTMGGYNTVWEVLSHRKRALIAPRTCPRQEQAIRARRLQELGLLDVLPQERVTPQAISDWLARPPAGPAVDPAAVVDMNGLRRLPELLCELLGGSPAPQPSPADAARVRLAAEPANELAARN